MQSCEGCKPGTKLGQGFKSMGWLSQRGEGEEEELCLPRRAVRAPVSTLPVDSLQAVPPAFLSALPQDFCAAGPIQEQTTCPSSQPLVWLDQESLGKTGSKQPCLVGGVLKTHQEQRHRCRCRVRGRCPSPELPEGREDGYRCIWLACDISRACLS